MPVSGVERLHSGWFGWMCLRIRVASHCCEVLVTSCGPGYPVRCSSLVESNDIARFKLQCAIPEWVLKGHLSQNTARISQLIRAIKSRVIWFSPVSFGYHNLGGLVGVVVSSPCTLVGMIYWVSQCTWPSLLNQVRRQLTLTTCTYVCQLLHLKGQRYEHLN